MRFKAFAALAAAFSLVFLPACGQKSPTKPEEPVASNGCPQLTEISGDSRYSVTLSSCAPAVGSTMALGSVIKLYGTISGVSPSDWMGFAAIRDDGQTYIDTIGTGSAVSDARTGMEWTLTSMNGLYDFGKGHRVDFLIVVGDESILQNFSWSAHMDHVRFHARVPMQFNFQ